MARWRTVGKGAVAGRGDRLVLFAVVIVLLGTIIGGFVRIFDVNERLRDVVHTNEQAIATNRKVLCSLGDLVQLTKQPRAAAIQGKPNHLRAELDFLVGIRESHCPLISPRARAEINGTIQLLQEHLARLGEG